jgi:hypothetical protein
MKNFFITALGLFWGFQCAEAAVSFTALAAM